MQLTPQIIKAIRKYEFENDINDSKLAEMVGITPATMHGWLSGKIKHARGNHAQTLHNIIAPYFAEITQPNQPQNDFFTSPYRIETNRIYNAILNLDICAECKVKLMQEIAKM